MELDDLLGKAYEQDQMAANKPGAIALLTEAFAADSGLRDRALAERTRLTDVVRERGQPHQHGCHVSAVCLNLLNLALDA